MNIGRVLCIYEKDASCSDVVEDGSLLPRCMILRGASSGRLIDSLDEVARLLHEHLVLEVLGVVLALGLLLGTEHSV